MDVVAHLLRGHVVGVPVPEDVAHVGAGNELQRPAAHPHLNIAIPAHNALAVILSCEDLPGMRSPDFHLPKYPCRDHTLQMDPV